LVRLGDPAPVVGSLPPRHGAALECRSGSAERRSPPDAFAQHGCTRYDRDARRRGGRKLDPRECLVHARRKPSSAYQCRSVLLRLRTTSMAPHGVEAQGIGRDAPCYLGADGCSHARGGRRARPSARCPDRRGQGGRTRR
jgi:hypothetical protein